MVATVTLSELDLNAIAAALDARTLTLTADLVSMIAQGADDFDIECVRDGLNSTVEARKTITAVYEDDYPEDMTVAALDSATLWHEYLDR